MTSDQREEKEENSEEILNVPLLSPACYSNFKICNALLYYSVLFKHKTNGHQYEDVMFQIQIIKTFKDASTRQAIEAVSTVTVDQPWNTSTASQNSTTHHMPGL